MSRPSDVFKSLADALARPTDHCFDHIVRSEDKGPYLGPERGPYFGVCACGWQSSPKARMSEARRAVSSHAGQARRRLAGQA